IIRHDLPTDFDYSTQKRPSFYECAQAVLADCDSALAQPNLPWRTKLEAERGAMTKSVAVAIKSQAILFAASPLWNGGINYWTEAAAITKASLDALLGKNYALYNPATSPVKAYSNYQRFFLVRPEMLENPANDKETIYSQKGQVGAVWQQHGLPFVADVVKAGACPSQELVDAYETLNGQPVLDLANPYQDADHLIPNYNTANTQYDKNNPYKNRDPRLFSTIYCNGVFHNLANNTVPVWTYDGGNAGISQTDNRFTRTGYYLRKFKDFTSTKTANKDGY
ncbi:MAG: RagB/SusD family nutrient uptake outer membrane protein, partial [Firmicutes bacterium]|nr:RagB/SusD family nutrient uptake outer membrane protein [Bacillota bacterium]